MKIKFATKENVKESKGGLVMELPLMEDHVLGGTAATPKGVEFEILQPTGQWSDDLPVQELQRNKYGDTYMCVSFSNNNVQETLIKKRYGVEANLSDLFLGRGSGTRRGRGNGKRTVAEWRRKNGYVLESDYAYTPKTTLDQAYKALSKTLLNKGMANKDNYQYLYKWLGSMSPSGMMQGLKISPLQVDIYGSYPMNSEGYVVWQQGMSYNHEVMVFGYEEGKCWHVFDSEHDQFLKFDWNYPLGNPMIHSIKKKEGMAIYKKKGLATLAVKHLLENSLIAFGGGSVDGGILFKSIYGIESFDKVEMIEVDEWPYPIKHVITTTPQR